MQFYHFDSKQTPIVQKKKTIFLHKLATDPIGNIDYAE